MSFNFKIMKKTILFALITLIVNSVLFAQVPPQKMVYQMVVRNANNELVSNQQVGVRLSIIKSSPNGNPVFVETHSATTNANALLTVQVGTGTPTPGSDLANIDWGGDDYYIQCDIDPLGGNNYTITGNQQVVTVPYAFYAGTADYNNLENRPPDGSNTGDILYWNSGDSSWHILPIGQQGQILTVHNGGLTWINNSNMLNNIPPTIVTDTIMDITGYTMTVKCSIVNSGSTGIIASGVCWSSSNPSPSIGNNYTTDGASVGSFLSHVSGLSSSTVYYVCAYATNSVGTSYGNVITITTPTHCGTVTDIDGNTYNTVYIGRQCWLKENLRTTTYADGIPITKATANLCQSSNVSNDNHNSNPSSCYYYPNNDSSNVYERGLLYTWEAVLRGAGSSGSNPSGILGVCPFGWHVPSSREWCELENVLNVGIDVNCSNTGWRGTMAKIMAKPKYWVSNSGNSFFPGYWTTDSVDFNNTGFSMIPAGYCYYTSSYANYYNACDNSGGYHPHAWYPNVNLNYYAYFWTSVSGEYRQFSYAQTGSYYGTGQATTTAMSVRCLKDYN